MHPVCGKGLEGLIITLDTFSAARISRRRLVLKIYGTLKPSPNGTNEKPAFRKALIDIRVSSSDTPHRLIMHFHPPPSVSVVILHEIAILAPPRSYTLPRSSPRDGRDLHLFALLNGPLLPFFLFSCSVIHVALLEYLATKYDASPPLMTFEYRLIQST